MTNLQKSQLQVQLNYALLGPVAMSVVGVLGALFCAPPSMPVWLGSSSHVGPLWLFIPRARSRMCHSSAIAGKDLVLPLLPRSRSGRCSTSPPRVPVQGCQKGRDTPTTSQEAGPPPLLEPKWLSLFLFLPSFPWVQVRANRTLSGCREQGFGVVKCWAERWS